MQTSEHAEVRPVYQTKRSDSPILRLKRLWWTTKKEARSAALWILGSFPLGLGVWLRARLMRYFFKHLGEHTILQQGLKVARPEMISIGSHCNFARGVFITGGGGVTIGDWVGFGPDVKIWSVNHRFSDPDTPWQLQGWEEKPVVIEDDVWLAANVFVMPGVTIGKGAIVSAGAVVSKSIPPYALVAGNPARVVGWRKQPGATSETPAEAARSEGSGAP
jgi:acetyltransferase-like isoleucine patch superfamily enzyme